MILLFLLVLLRASPVLAGPVDTIGTIVSLSNHAAGRCHSERSGAMSEVRQAESGDFLDDMEARSGGAGAAGAGAAAAAGAGDGASGGLCEH